MITEHKFQKSEERENCAECGMPLLEHAWKCEKCEMMGNGEDTHECKEEKAE